MTELITPVGAFPAPLLYGVQTPKGTLLHLCANFPMTDLEAKQALVASQASTSLFYILEKSISTLAEVHLHFCQHNPNFTGIVLSVAQQQDPEERKVLARFNFIALIHCLERLATKWQTLLQEHSVEVQFYTLQAAVDSFSKELFAPLAHSLKVRAESFWKECAEKHSIDKIKRLQGDFWTELKQTLTQQAISLLDVVRDAVHIDPLPKPFLLLKETSEWLYILIYDTLRISGGLPRGAPLLNWQEKAFLWQVIHIRLDMPLLLIGSRALHAVSAAMGSIGGMEILHQEVASPLILRWADLSRRWRWLAARRTPEQLEQWRHTLLAQQERGPLAQQILAVDKLQRLFYHQLQQVIKRMPELGQIDSSSTNNPYLATLIPIYLHTTRGYVRLVDCKEDGTISQLLSPSHQTLQAVLF